MKKLLKKKSDSPKKKTPTFHGEQPAGGSYFDLKEKDQPL